MILDYGTKRYYKSRKHPRLKYSTRLQAKTNNEYINRKGGEYKRMATEGFEDEDGLYNFELITKIKMV